MKSKLFLESVPDWFLKYEHRDVIVDEDKADEVMKIRRNAIRYLYDKDLEIRKIIRLLLCASNGNTTRDIIHCILYSLKNNWNVENVESPKKKT